MEVQKNTITRDEELSMAHELVSTDLIESKKFKNFQNLNKYDISVLLAGHRTIEEAKYQKECLITFLILGGAFFLNMFTFMYFLSV